MGLSGKVRVRPGRCRKLILQVEETYEVCPAGARPEVTVTRSRWRDATVLDLQQLGCIKLSGSNDRRT